MSTRECARTPRGAVADSPPMGSSPRPPKGPQVGGCAPRRLFGNTPPRSATPTVAARPSARTTVGKAQQPSASHEVKKAASMQSSVVGATMGTGGSSCSSATARPCPSSPCGGNNGSGARVSCNQSGVIVPESSTPDPCTENCCWRWLTAVLMRELKEVKTSIADVSRAFVEQERAFVGLEYVEENESYSELKAELQRRRAEYETYRQERPRLQRETEELWSGVKAQQQAVLQEEETVAQMRAELESVHSRRELLQGRIDAAEADILKTAAAKRPLKVQLQELEATISRQKEVLDMVLLDHNAYKTQVDFLRCSVGLGDAGSPYSKPDSRKTPGPTEKRQMIGSPAAASSSASPISATIEASPANVETIEGETAPFAASVGVEATDDTSCAMTAPSQSPPSVGSNKIEENRGTEHQESVVVDSTFSSPYRQGRPRVVFKVTDEDGESEEEEMQPDPIRLTKTIA
eukprot:TRINITY_DN70884_c0_g1_i1.p1 TRINITY_DN70884_c0_g1~~TRINITY_DN70884_c0_g1_i1.p1  ORF type:complete len:464 (-),score=82.07 TRINITY_DN70884_c0_g1_i1:51-1442(-)